jgi:tetratricopeptide (TPR) repeat protein
MSLTKTITDQFQRLIEISDLSLTCETLRSRQDQDIVLIWFDERIDIEVKRYFQSIYNLALIYSDKAEFLSSITSATNENIFLILSPSNVDEILPLMDVKTQIVQIFLFCLEKDRNTDLLKIYPKIIGIFTDYKALFEAVQRSIRITIEQMVAIRLFDQNQKGLKDLSEELSEFLWYQLLRDYLMTMPRNHNDKQIMIDQCRLHYRDNPTYLSYIDEFEQNYSSKDAIRWYTRTGFLYRLINQALRTEDIEPLFILRFYIIDLCTWLKTECETNREYICGIKVTVYRGLTLSDDVLEKLKTNIGHLISTNGFLSASKSLDVACLFATNVILKIIIDTDLEEIIFADVTSYSMIPSEEEVLFDLGTIFRVESVQYEQTIDKWIVSLVGTNENELAINDYIRIQREELKQRKKIYRRKDYLLPELDHYIEGEFASVLIDMGLYGKAIRYLEKLLSQTTLVEHQIQIEFLLSNAYFHNREYQLALKSAIQAYDLCRQFRPASLCFSAIFNLLGRIHKRQMNHNLAIEYYRKSYEKLNTNHNEPLSDKYDIMGHLYLLQFQYGPAIKYFQAALGMHEQFYPMQHPDIANEHYKIGLAYFNACHFHLALEHMKKALEIQTKILPAKHPDLGLSYWLMGRILEKQSSYELAVEFYLKSLRIKEVVSRDHYFGIAELYDFIAYCYDRNKNYNLSIEYHLKTIETYQRYLPTFDHTVAMIQFDLAWIYFAKDEYDLAIDILTKSLVIKQENYSPQFCTDHYYLFGLCYEKKNQLDLAMEFYMKSLIGYETNSSYNFPQCSNIYQKIGGLYQRMDSYDLSIESYRKAKIIEENLKTEEPLIFATIHYNIGLSYLFKNEYDYSIEEFSKALEFYLICSAMPNAYENLPPQENPYAFRFSKDHYAKELSPSYDIELYIAYAYHYIVYSYVRKDMLDLSIQYSNRIFELYEKGSLSNIPLISETYETLAWLLMTHEHHQSALEHYHKSLLLQENIIPVDECFIAALHHSIAWCYHHLHEHNFAIENCQKSLCIYEMYADTSYLDYANALNSIAHMYYQVKDYEKAWENCTKSMEIYIANKIPFHENLAVAENFEIFANIHFVKGQKTLAFDYYLKSLELLNQMKPVDQKCLARVQNSLKNIDEIEF